MMQSRRVWLTISRMAGTPRPSSPTSCAHDASISISADALDRLPSLSLSRWSRKPFRLPFGEMRGTRKQESPFGACARTRKASLIGAEQNHLCPVNRQALPSRTARVVFARTSEPPCFSVIAIPMRTPRLADAGIERGSYVRLTARGSHSRASSGVRRSAGTAE